ncbi:MAG TPA: WYL domain-containing protein [Spirochaetota bacterium]|nr:WYL domain-containing protein [Spirochaetota bacterium]
MVRKKDNNFPNPEGKINVLKRYLHILALLQSPPGTNETWNAARLAQLLSLEEDEKDISDSHVRKYIKDHIENELGISVDRTQGGLITALAEDLDPDMQLEIARVYSSFVVKDSTRDMILQKFIAANPDRALWTLARVYFAALEKRMIQCSYKTNEGQLLTDWKLCPCYFIFRNNNLYLIVYDVDMKKYLPLVAERIQNIVVCDKKHDISWEVPDVDELFATSLSAFIDNTNTVEVTIRYSQVVKTIIENIIASLQPAIQKEPNNWHRATFTISDYLYLCKQLVLYGREVEIVSPHKVRQAMIHMLKESLSVYEQ